MSAFASGPLRPHPGNPRYFADAEGRPMLLAGCHTWAVFQERGIAGTTPDFDYPGWLDALEATGQNFLRLWTWEHARGVQFSDDPIRFTPLPYRRTGTGTANDGNARFDLDSLDPAWFERLCERVAAAGARGIYVSVMLFQGFSVERKVPGGVTTGGDPWLGHPFHRDNNANGIDGDPGNAGHGRAVHSLAIPAITALQERHVARVVEAVGDFDHVLFEVCNEPHPDAWDWQLHMMEHVRRSLPAGRRLPVGLGASYPHGTSNARLAASGADWISPEHTAAEPYKWDPPVADAPPVVLLDSDHVFGVGGDADWVWRAFFRGANPVVMDPWNDVRFRDDPGDTRNDPRWQETRRALGAVRRLADRIDLTRLVPRPDLASSGYCLSDGESEMLVYWPLPGRGLRSLRPRSFALRVTFPRAAQWRGAWLDPITGEEAPAFSIGAAGTTVWRGPGAKRSLLRVRA